MHRYQRRFGENQYRGRKGGYADAVDQVFGPVELPDPKLSVVSGLKAGVIGGIVMTLTLLAAYNSAGSSPFLPMQVLMLNATGNAALAGSVLGFLLAVLTVLTGTAALGGLFGLLVAKFIGKLSVFGSVGVGMTYGLLIWIVSQYVILGFIAPNAIVLYDQNALALSHAVYGVCLGLFGRAYHKN